MLLNRRGKKIIRCGIILFRVTQCDRKNFNVDISRQSVMGHSMGGHGIVTPFQMNIKWIGISVCSICNPMESDWGRKQFSAYLGSIKTMGKL